jgi:hypothetical protein
MGCEAVWRIGGGRDECLCMKACLGSARDCGSGVARDDSPACACR